MRLTRFQQLYTGYANICVEQILNSPLHIDWFNKTPENDGTNPSGGGGGQEGGQEGEQAGEQKGEQEGEQEEEQEQEQENA